MDAGIAGEAFEDSGVVPELAHGRFVVDGGLEFGIFRAGGVEIDVQLVGDHLGEAVAVAVAPTHHAGDITHHTLRSQRAESDDLGDRALAVFLTDILDHLAASDHAKIHIDVGRAHALGVEEALENEAVADGVDIGDSQRIRDDRTGCGAASRADGDAHVFGLADEIPDDEKVAGEAGFLDDGKFVVEALSEFGLGVHARAVAFEESLAAEVAEVLFAGAGVGGIEAGVFGNIEFHFEIAALCDSQRVVAGFGKFGEEGAHFFGGFEIQLGAVAKPSLIDDIGICADADEDIMGLVVGFFEEVDIVRRNEAEVERAGDFDEIGIDAALRIEAEIVEFDEVVFRAEYLAVLRSGRAGFFKIPVGKLRCDFAFQAAAERDDALGVCGEALVIHARLVIKALEKSGCGELHEIAVALVVCGQQREVECGVPGGGGIAIGHRAGGDINLAADDGFHAGLGGGLVKRNGGVHVAVVGDGDGGHSKRGGFFYQIVRANRSVEQGKFRVAMQVNERHLKSLTHRADCCRTAVEARRSCRFLVGL